MSFPGSHRTLLAVVAVLAALSARAEDRPNIIWLYADDHAVQALSAYGGRLAELAPTPNLDRLANDGMLFRRSYVANSICAPARACVLTGQHSHKNGVYTNRGRIDYDQVTTFPERLRDAGYHTAIFGKWHLKSQPQGFDEWSVLPGQGRYYHPDFRTRDPEANDGERREIFQDRHTSEVIMDKTLAHLDTIKDGDEPLMVMCQFKAPHRNWNPDWDLADFYKDTAFPEPATLHDDYATRATAAHEQEMTILEEMSLGRDLKFAMRPDGVVPEDREDFYAFYEARRQDYASQDLEGEALTEWKYQAYLQDYLACIKGIDEQIGRLLDYLDENGLADNTLVAYSSDQGFYLGEHGWFDKRFMYEPSFQTPLVVRWPGHTAPGSHNLDLVQNIDVAPTFLQIAGAEIPDAIDGRSLVPLLRQPAEARESVELSLVDGETVTRDSLRVAAPLPDWRKTLYYHYYEYPGVHAVRRHEGVFDGRWKLIRYYGPDVPGEEEWELFDIANDPSEVRNLMGHTGVQTEVDRLRAELERLKAFYQVNES